MPDNENIQIAMLELSDQNRAVLDYYFSSAGKKLFTVVSEDKADAFITDYDYPGAKDYLSKIQSTHNKPVVVLSIREQDLPSTAWLAKPITGHALAKTADQLLLMMAENAADEAATTEALVAETVAVETVVAETVDTETLIAETVSAETQTVETSQTVEINNNDTVSVTDIEIPIFEDESILNESDDIFDILVEKEEQLDENKKIAARLAMTSAAALVSATISANNNSNKNIDSQEIAKNTKLHEGSHLEFTDILLDSETELHTETESEGEVDALLEALILGEGKKAKKTSPEVITKSNEDDIFLESLALDNELDANTVVKSQADEFVELTQQDNAIKSEKVEIKPEESKLEDTSSENASLESTISENLGLEKNELNDIDLLAEGIAVEEDSSILIEEEESILLDKNFTIHDDLNPAEEDIYANTLEVDYADIKSEDTKIQISTNEEVEFELETNDRSIQEENNLTADIEEPLETDLFNFDIDSSDDVDVATTSTESTDETDEIALTMLDDAPSDNTPSGISNFNTDLDSDAGTDLDNLLKEVLVETNRSDDIQEKVTEISSFIKDTPLIEDDFDDKDKAVSVDENKDTEDLGLQSLLDQVREEASTDPDTESFGGDVQKANAFKKTNEEKRWLQLCGSNEDITAQKEVAKLSFTLKDHLLGVLLKQIESIKDSEQLYRLKYDDLIIVLDHSEDSIYCNLPIANDEYSEICFSEIEHKKIKIHDLDYSEIRLYRKKIEENPDRAHTFESFIWSTSLLTSRGRLPDSTDITKKVELKVWPNLTRVELLPHTMHIAAAFSKHPGNLLEISEWLDIEQRYIFAFYNATLSLDMLELDSSKMKKPSFSFGKKSSKGKSEERSFFGRLLKRLKS